MVASDAADGAAEGADEATAEGVEVVAVLAEDDAAAEALAEAGAAGDSEGAAPAEETARGIPPLPAALATALVAALAEGRAAELVRAAVGRGWPRRNT